MVRKERMVVYGLLGVALLAAAGQGLGLRITSTAGANPTPAVDPARLATCDVYQLVERMVEGDSYVLTRNADQERIKTLLRPLEMSLDQMQSQLQHANQDDPAVQTSIKNFQSQRDEYLAKRQSEADRYSDLVTGQFTDAYGKVCAEAKRVAEKMGYAYVISQKKGEIIAHNPRQLVEEFLSRPMAIAPVDADITEAVRAAMKLPTAPAVPATGTGPDGQLTPAPTPPAVPPLKANEPKK